MQASKSASTALPAPSSTTSAPASSTSSLKRQLRGMSFDEGASAVQCDVGSASGDVHAAAARGTAGSGGALPHGAAIQRAFGAHDVGGVRAHVGGEARGACESMGASAFASGDAVAFKGEPDLHTAAHEAAHVIQQKAGVSLAGGVGASGDRYEQEADAVADRVVQGKSAEDLLPAAAAGGSAVQRKAVQRLSSGDGYAAGLLQSFRAGDQARWASPLASAYVQVFSSTPWSAVDADLQRGWAELGQYVDSHPKDGNAVRYYNDAQGKIHSEPSATTQTPGQPPAKAPPKAPAKTPPKAPAKAPAKTPAKVPPKATAKTPPKAPAATDVPASQDDATSAAPASSAHPEGEADWRDQTYDADQSDAAAPAPASSTPAAAAVPEAPAPAARLPGIDEIRAMTPRTAADVDQLFSVAESSSDADTITAAMRKLESVARDYLARDVSIEELARFHRHFETQHVAREVYHDRFFWCFPERADDFGLYDFERRAAEANEAQFEELRNNVRQKAPELEDKLRAVALERARSAIPDARPSALSRIKNDFPELAQAASESFKSRFGDDPQYAIYRPTFGLKPLPPEPGKEADAKPPAEPTEEPAAHPADKGAKHDKAPAHAKAPAHDGKAPAHHAAKPAKHDDKADAPAPAEKWVDQEKLQAEADAKRDEAANKRHEGKGEGGDVEGGLVGWIKQFASDKDVSVSLETSLEFPTIFPWLKFTPGLELSAGWSDGKFKLSGKVTFGAEGKAEGAVAEAFLKLTGGVEIEAEGTTVEGAVRVMLLAIRHRVEAVSKPVADAIYGGGEASTAGIGKDDKGTVSTELEGSAGGKFNGVDVEISAKDKMSFETSGDSADEPDERTDTREYKFKLGGEIASGELGVSFAKSGPSNEMTLTGKCVLKQSFPAAIELVAGNLAGHAELLGDRGKHLRALAEKVQKAAAKYVPEESGEEGKDLEHEIEMEVEAKLVDGKWEGSITLKKQYEKKGELFGNEMSYKLQTRLAKIDFE